MNVFYIKNNFEDRINNLFDQNTESFLGIPESEDVSTATVPRISNKPLINLVLKLK